MWRYLNYLIDFWDFIVLFPIKIQFFSVDIEMARQPAIQNYTNQDKAEKKCINWKIIFYNLCSLEIIAEHNLEQSKSMIKWQKMYILGAARECNMAEKSRLKSHIQSRY